MSHPVGHGIKILLVAVLGYKRGVFSSVGELERGRGAFRILASSMCSPISGTSSACSEHRYPHVPDLL
jgi:hypothetical protein